MANLPKRIVDAAAAAIANARIMRRGAPAISNVLDILPKKLRDEVEADAEAALDAAVEASTPFGGWWIACSEAMPEEEIHVILFSPSLGVAVGRLSWEQGAKPVHFAVDDRRRWEVEDVTHWLPIPTTPKQS